MLMQIHIFMNIIKEMELEHKFVSLAEYYNVYCIYY